LANMNRYLYLLFTTFTVVFEVQYGFSSSTVGLSFLGLGIGNMLGLAVFGVVSDKIIARQAIITTQPDGTTKSYTKPEARLPPAIPAAFLLPIGYLIYGWTADYRVNMYVPIFGTLVIGLSNIIMFMAIQTYMVDAFTLYAAR
jgi:MFS family permease